MWIGTELAPMMRSNDLIIYNSSLPSVSVLALPACKVHTVVKPQNLNPCWSTCYWSYSRTGMFLHLSQSTDVQCSEGSEKVLTASLGGPDDSWLSANHCPPHLAPWCLSAFSETQWKQVKQIKSSKSTHPKFFPLAFTKIPL